MTTKKPAQDDKAKPTLKEMLLTPEARTDGLTPPRRQRRRRTPPAIE